MSTTPLPQPGDPWSLSSRLYSYPDTAVPSPASPEKAWFSWYLEATVLAATMPLVIVALGAGSLVPGTSVRLAAITALIAAALCWPFFAAIAGVCRLIPEGLTRISVRTLLLLPATLLAALIVFLTGLTTGAYELDFRGLG